MKDPKFLIVISGYNCEQYVKDCLESVKAQTYYNYEVAIVDDASTDSTSHQIMKHIKPSWLFIKKKINGGTVRARDLAITSFGKEFDVIAWLDLDDRLLPDALQKISNIYQQNNCWLTYGGYIDTYGRRFYGELSDNYRQDEWKFIHLRTFKKELYFKLTNEDLYPKIAKVYPDINMLYCMLELAGNDRIYCVKDDTLYQYADNNPMSVIKRFSQEERDAELAFVKSLKPKERLESL